MIDGMKLTEKQKRFADEYIRTGNIGLSAINAGYSEKSASVTGNENLKKPNIKAYIDARLDELKKKSIAEQDEILQYLTSVMRGEVTDQENITVPLGDYVSEVQQHERRSDTNARTKAAELLGKRYMMWTDKQEVDVKGVVNFNDDID